MFRTVSNTASNVVALCTTTCIFVAALSFLPVNVTAQWLSYEAISERLSTRCNFGEFDCALGDDCIPLSKFRDGHTDCLDGSDEFCFPGQIKCGSHCVELIHFGECLANPYCDNSTTLPVYCNLIKSKLCQFEDALPCKGYGECVLRKWLDDGQKDCFDGSDEDPGYVKLLTSCLYPEKGPPLPADGFIEVPEPDYNPLPYTPKPNYPIDSSAATPFNPYRIVISNNPATPSLPNLPGVLGIPTISPPKQTSNNILDNFGSELSVLPNFGQFPTFPPIIFPITVPGGELVPIKSKTPFTSITLPGSTNANTLQTLNPFPDFSTLFPGFSGPTFGKIGVEQGKGGIFQPEQNFGITPINNQPQRPASPFVDTTNKHTGAEKETDNDDSNWVEVDTTEKEEEPFSDIATRDPSKVTWSPYKVINNHRSTHKNVQSVAVSSTVSTHGIDEKQKTVSGSNFENGDWIVVQEGSTKQPTSKFTTTSTKTTLKTSKTEAEKSEIFAEFEPTTVISMTPLFETTSGDDFEDVIPVTTLSQTPSTKKTSMTQRYSTTTVTDIVAVTETYFETSSIKVISSNLVETDPNMFPYGIEERLTTSAPNPRLNCTENMKKIASELAPTPMCDCPPGQMRDLKGQCIIAEISTFRARVIHLCGSNVKNIENEDQILAWKLATTFNYPLCVRQAGDLIILNTVCNGCEFTDLIDTYAMNNDLPEIDVKLSELQDSACYQFSINDCDEKAECVPQGLRYKCMCLPGTTDTVDGSGRHCVGTVIANQCTKFLGVCVLFWILLLLFLLTMCHVLAFFAYKYCKRHNIRVFNKQNFRKKGADIPPVGVQKGNIELGVSTNDVVQTQQESRSTTGVAFPTIATPTSPAASKIAPTNKFMPADEYCIIENDENEEDDGAKAETTSVTLSHESFAIIDKTPIATSRVSTPDAPVIRKATSDSRSSTPTIWESYKILGPQYTRFNSAKRRRSSSHSLEMLMHKKREDEVKRQRLIMINVPNVGIVDSPAAALPPLPIVSLPASSSVQPVVGEKLLDRRGSRASVASTKSKVSEQAAKLAEMLGVTGSIPEQQVQAIAEATALEIMRAIEPDIETIKSSEGIVPSTPEIYRAAEIAVTDALKNVIGPHYEHKPPSTPSSNHVPETEVNIDRLQTMTKSSSPRTPRNDTTGDTSTSTLPPSIPQEIIEPVVLSTSRPPSALSQKIRTVLPTPTIEDNTTEIAANLDEVAAALSQLPPLPPLSKKDDKAPPNTHPSSAKNIGKNLPPKTSRSLSGECERGSVVNSSKSTHKASDASKTPVTKRQKSKTPRSEPLSRLPTTARRTSTQEGSLTKREKISGLPGESKVVPDKTLPLTKSRTGSVSRLPPIPRQTSASSVTVKKASSSNPPTARKPVTTNQLPKIESTSSTPRKVARKQPIKPLPPINMNSTVESTSTPNTTREDVKATPPSKPTSGRSTSRLPKLVDPEKAKSSVSYRCDEPNFILADLDLDLPGPYMIPAKSIEDLCEAGLTSRLPRLKQKPSSQSAPNTDRQDRQGDGNKRQHSAKSEKLSITSTYFDVDLDIGAVSSFDVDTAELERCPKQPTSTIAKKIASRKAAGLDYALPKISVPPRPPVYEYTRPTVYQSHVHDGCIRDRPPWDASPIREGDINMIPFDWNTSRSNSSMSLSDRRTQSFGDVHKLTAVGFLSARPDFARQLTQSGSLTNLFHFKAKIRGVDVEWANDLKQSLKKNNSWLDYD